MSVVGGNKLFKVASQINIGRDAIVEYLVSKGHKIENKATAVLSDEMVDLVIEKFAKELKVAEKQREKVKRQQAVRKSIMESGSTISIDTIAEQHQRDHDIEERMARVDEPTAANEPLTATHAEPEVPVVEDKGPKVGEVIDLDGSKKRELEAAKARELEEAKVREIEYARIQEVENAKAREIENSKTQELENSKTQELKTPTADTVQPKEFVAEVPKEVVAEAPKHAPKEPAKETKAPAQTVFGESSQIGSKDAVVAANAAADAAAPATADADGTAESEEKKKRRRKGVIEVELQKGAMPKLRGLTVLGKIDIAPKHKPQDRPKRTGGRDDRQGGGKPTIGDAVGANRPAARGPQQNRPGGTSSPGGGGPNRRPGGGPGPGSGTPGKSIAQQREEERAKKKKAGRGGRETVSDTDVNRAIRQTLSGMEESGATGRAKIRQRKKLEREEREAVRQQEIERESTTLKLSEFVTTADLGNLMRVSAADIIMKCMGLG